MSGRHRQGLGGRAGRTLPLRGSLAIVCATAAGACAVLTIVPAAFGTGERPHQIDGVAADLTAQTTLTQPPVTSQPAATPAPAVRRTATLAVTRKAADRRITGHSSTTQTDTGTGDQVPQGAPGPIPHNSTGQSSSGTRHAAQQEQQSHAGDDDHRGGRHRAREHSHRHH